MSECPLEAVNGGQNCYSNKELVYPIETPKLVECTPTPSIYKSQYVEREFIVERDLVDTNFTGLSVTPAVTYTPTPSITPTYTPTNTVTPSLNLVPSQTPTNTQTPTPTRTPTPAPSLPVKFSIQFDIRVATEARLVVNLVTSEIALFHAVEGNFPTEPKYVTYRVTSGSTTVFQFPAEWKTVWQEPRLKGSPPASTRVVQFSNGTLTYGTNKVWKVKDLNTAYTSPGFDNSAYLKSIEQFRSAGSVVTQDLLNISQVAGATVGVAGSIVLTAGAFGVGGIGGLAAAASVSWVPVVGWIVFGVALIFSLFGFGKPPPKRKIPQWSGALGLPLPIATTHRKVTLKGGSLPYYTKDGSLKIADNGYPTKDNAWLLIVELKNVATTVKQPGIDSEGFQFTVDFEEG